MSTANSKMLVDAIDMGELTKTVFKRTQYHGLYRGLANIRGCEFAAKFADCKDVLRSLAEISPNEKVKILHQLSSIGFLEENPRYYGIIPHVFRPERTPIKGVKVLKQDEETDFKIDIPIDTFSTFMGMQYLDIEFNQPELADESLEYLSSAKFSHPAKPGIRNYPEISFVSNNNIVQRYDYLDVLRYDKEEIKPSFHKQWNRHIGNELYETANVYNHALEIDYGVKTKTGYQTPKHKQENLSLRVPLLFDYNKCFGDRFNLNTFLNGSLTVVGKLAKSVNMVKAEFYPSDLTLPIVQLKCKPLKVKCFSLVTLKYFVDDQLHSIMSNKPLSKFVRYFSNKTGTIKDSDTEQMIPINGKGYVENITFCLRPASYEHDFDKWHNLSEVSHQCSPTVIVTPDENGDLKKLAIKPANIQKPVASLCELGLFSGGDEIKPMFDPNYYGDMEAYRVAKEFDNYHPRDNMLYKFNFNYHWKQNMLSGMLAQSKIEDIEIHYKFKDGYADSAGLLKEKWQYIIYRDLCNQQFAMDSSITTLYLL